MVQLNTPGADAPVVILETTKGKMTAVLYPEHAPKACENFLTLAGKGYYEGVIFHRVIEDFMVQCGDPTGTGRGGESCWGEPFPCEITGELRHFHGALAMANKGAGTVSNGSQFYVVTAGPVDSGMAAQMKSAGWPEEVINAYCDKGGTPHLDGGYSVFGQVIEGVEVAEEISKVATGAADKPVDDIKIEKITVTTYGELA